MKKILLSHMLLQDFKSKAIKGFDEPDWHSVQLLPSFVHF